MAGSLIAPVVLVTLAVAAGAVALALADDPGARPLRAPAVAVSGDGLAAALWTEVGRPGLRLARETAPGAWSPPELVAPRAGGGDVAFDSEGRPVVAYTGADGLTVEVRGTAGPTRWLVDPDARGTPSIAVTRSDAIAVAYQTRSGGRNKYAWRRPGAPWTRYGSPLQGRPHATVDGRDRLWIAGCSDRRCEVVPRSGRTAIGGALGTGTAAADGIQVAPSPGGLFMAYQIGERPGVVLAAYRPDLRGPAAKPFNVQGVAPASLLFPNTDVASAREGEGLVLLTEPRRNRLDLYRFSPDRSLEATGVRLPGRAGAVALDAGASRAVVAFWDPGGRQLRFARLDMTSDGPRLTAQGGVSTLQASFPGEDRWAISLAAVALLLMLLAGALVVVRRRPGLEAVPLALVGLVLAGCAVRGLYIAYAGRYGLYPHDQFVLDRGHVEPVVSALLVLAAAAAAMWLAWVLVPIDRALAPVSRALARLPIGSPRAAGVTFVLALGLSLLALAVLVVDGSIGEVVSNRQVVFAERGYLLLLLAAAPGAFLVLVGVSLTAPSRPPRRWLAAAALATLAVAVLTGARSSVVLGVLLPLGLVLIATVRGISPALVAAGLAVVAVGAVGYRVLVREGSTSYAARPVALQGGAERALDRVFAGSEINALDGLILVRSEYLPRFGAEPGRSVLALASTPVPRAWWAGKPRGAMETFSRRTNPYRFETSRVGQTTSLAGDLAMNGRIAAILIGFALLGVIALAFGRLLAGAGGLVGVLLAAVTVPRLASATWGDIQNAAIGAVTTGLAVCLALLCATLGPRAWSAARRRAPASIQAGGRLRRRRSPRSREAS